MAVYLIAGVAGTGKTELGRELGRALRCAVLDKDTVVGPLAEVCAAVVGVGRAYSTHVRPREYEALHDTVFTVAEHVADVVAVAPWLGYVDDPAWEAQVRARARAAGHAAVIVWVACADTSLRGRRRAPSDVTDVDYWADAVDGRAARAPGCADMVVDTTRTPAARCAVEVIAHPRSVRRGL